MTILFLFKFCGIYLIRMRLKTFCNVTESLCELFPFYVCERFRFAAYVVPMQFLGKPASRFFEIGA